MKIIFLGTPSYLDPIIQTLDENFDLIKVVRSTSDSLDSLTHLTPDLLVVASFGKIIPAEILESAKLGAINIHPSKLPEYRGPSPIQSQILDGVTDSSISFILMDSEMDHGPIIFQEPFGIKPDDTFESLCQKMFAKSADSLPKVISEFARGKLKPVTQNHAIASFCNTLKKEDGYFDIGNPPNSQALGKMIRAYYPWPGTYTKWNGKIVKFLPNPNVIAISRSEEAISDRTGIATSPVSSAPRNDEKYLIQMEGKKAVPIKDFLNGYPKFPVIELL